MDNQIVSLIANLAIALSFLVALIIGIAQVRAATRDRKERLTLDMLRGFQTREFAEHLFVVSSKAAPLTYKDFQELPHDERVTFIQFAQEMESLGLMVAERLIDLDLVDKTLGSFVVTAWDKYKILFTDMRETMPDPFLGEYFQWLAERIEERMRDKPREPFYKRK